jgi:hypothetical protein
MFCSKWKFGFLICKKAKQIFDNLKAGLHWYLFTRKISLMLNLMTSWNKFSLEHMSILLHICCTFKEQINSGYQGSTILYFVNYFCLRIIFWILLGIDYLQISEEENDINSSHKPLVTTQFVDWSSKYFAQPVMKFLEDNDVESSLHYEREWRYLCHMNV